MTPGRPGILLDFIGPQTVWSEEFLADNLAAEFFPVGTSSRADLIDRHRPDVALIIGGDAQACRESLAACKETVPGMLCVLVASLDAETMAALERDFHLFAHTTSDIPAFELVAILKKALAFVRLSRLQIAELKSRHQRRNQPAHWLMAKERGEKKEKLAHAQSLIRNILHSASQGLGIGAVITYVDLMQMSVSAENKMPNPDVFNALVKNANAARQWLASFENILKGLQKIYVPENLSADDVQQVLSETAAGIDSLRKIRNHHLMVRPVQFSGKVTASATAIRDIIGELLLNAFKYSPAESTVSIMCYGTSEFISLAVVNDIERMGGGVTGIPVEQEAKLFEPFFRLNNTWDDRYQEQKLGLGVGLTLAENAAQQIMSRVYVYEIDLPKVSHTEDSESQGKIVAELVMQKTE